MDLPEISIIVPVFNEAACLPDLFASLEAQRRIRFELILCDGGSTDKTIAEAEAPGGSFLFLPFAAM